MEVRWDETGKQKTEKGGNSKEASEKENRETLKGNKGKENGEKEQEKSETSVAR